MLSYTHKNETNGLELYAQMFHLRGLVSVERPFHSKDHCCDQFINMTNVFDRQFLAKAQ
jgi:hypothetical protein